MRERVEILELLGRLIELAVAVPPRVRLGGNRLLRLLELRADELHAQLQLILRRRSAEERAIQRLYALRRLRRLADLRAGGELARLLEDERAVHHVERLLRHGGCEPLRAGRIGRCEVEGAEGARKVLPLDERVDAASRDERLREDVDAASSHGF